MAMNETPHVLIVDDSREIRDTLSRYLEQHGYRVATAEDATAGGTSNGRRRGDGGAAIAKRASGKRRECGPSGDGARPLLPGRVRSTNGRAQDGGPGRRERLERRRRCQNAHAGELILCRGPDRPARRRVGGRRLWRPLPVVVTPSRHRDACERRQHNEWKHDLREDAEPPPRRCGNA